MLRAVGFSDGDFEKPIVGVANGHSTMNPCNAGIQPLVDAIAAAAEVEWSIDDFERVRKRVPVLCDLKPSGKYVAIDFHNAGGVPRVLKILLEAGLLHGDCMTITGRTMAEELARVPAQAKGAHRPGFGRIGGTRDRWPFFRRHLGGWSWGTSPRRPTSAARSRSYTKAIPSPSMRRLLLQLNVPDDELARRRAAWKPPPPRYTRGLLAKYRRLVSTVSKGAITGGKEGDSTI